MTVQAKLVTIRSPEEIHSNERGGGSCASRTGIVADYSSTPILWEQELARLNFKNIATIHVY